MVTRITRWAREKVDPDLVTDAINDACEVLWMAASLASLSKFVGKRVTQIIPSETLELVLTTVADPTAPAQTAQIGGGQLPVRQYTVSYSLVTDSGSETKESPAITINVDANTLATITPPQYVEGAFGYAVYAGIGDRRTLQTPQPLPFNITWIEPPIGINSAPNGPLPPQTNTTGDNISSIARLDILNSDGTTYTNWQQTNIGSSAFTRYQSNYPTTATYQRYAYDLISSDRLQIRPVTGTDLTANAFFIIRPRRLRFPDSKLPYVSAIPGAQVFIGRSALSDTLLSLYEREAADDWAAKSKETLEQIVLAIGNESASKNDSVTPYRPGRNGGGWR